MSVWVLSCSVTDLAGATPLKETDSPFLSSSQLPVAPQLGMDCQDFVWFQRAQILRMPPQSLSFPVYNCSSLTSATTSNL